MLSERPPSRRPGRGPVLLSVSLHVVILIAMWAGYRFTAEEIEYVTYEIDLVTVADPEAAEAPPPEPVVETPNLPPPEPEPEEPEPEPEPEPEEPEPEPEPEEPEEPEPEPEVVEQPPEPEEQPDIENASTEEMAVRMEGLRRDFPRYYAQIVSEINRCFRPTGQGWTTVLRFEIESDGQIRGSTIQVHSPSGNPSFDIEAFAAVECAGRRLGPLPPDLPYDQLLVQFTFQPS